MGVLLAAALAIFTTHKLYRMAWIRGIVGDARVERRAIAGKARQPRGSRETCLFVLRADDANRSSRPDVQADCDYWEHKQIGDLIDLVDTGDGDVYLREGDIYTSSGNFMFDLVLLAAELTAAIYCLRRLRRGATAS